MSEILSEHQKNPIPISSPPAVTRRMFVAAIALGLALLVSFLFTRYFAYRTIQENFYGQALVPARAAFDFHLVDQDGKPLLPRDIKGKVGFLGGNLRATYDFAKKTAGVAHENFSPAGT